MALLLFTQPPPALRCEWTRMIDLSSRHRAHLAGFHGKNLCRMTVEGEEFHFVGFAILIDVNDRAHVAGHKSVRRERRRQNDSIVLFNHVLRTDLKETWNAAFSPSEPAHCATRATRSGAVL